MKVLKLDDVDIFRTDPGSLIGFRGGQLRGTCDVVVDQAAEGGMLAENIAGQMRAQRRSGNAHRTRRGAQQDSCGTLVRRAQHVQP